MGELAVVREQQRPRRVGVEAADRDDPRGMVDETDDGRAAPGVARRRDDPGRLVEQDVRDPLLYERKTVEELDEVVRADERVQPPGRPFTRAPGLDQLVCATPRRDPGPAQPRVQPHGREDRTPADETRTVSGGLNVAGSDR